MVHGVYAVRDRTGEQCGPIYQAKNHGVAARQFVGLMRKIPGYDRDAFALWYFGDFDDELGRLTVLAEPSVVDVNLPKFPEDDGQLRLSEEM